MELNNTPQHKSFLWHLDFEPFTWHTFYGEQCPPFITEENQILCLNLLSKLVIFYDDGKIGWNHPYRKEYKNIYNNDTILRKI